MISSKDCWLKDHCKKYTRPTDDFNCKDEDIYCQKLVRLSVLYDNACLSKKQRAKKVLLLDADERDKKAFEDLSDIEKNIVKFVNNGQNLYIHSHVCGNGKTSWAVRMIQAYLEKIWAEVPIDSTKALFINVPRFLLTLKDSITNQSDYIDHIKQTVLDADLVVWDEVGVKALTNYEHEQLLNIINTRIDEGKSNIYTSNLEPDELRDKVGERLYSRITQLSDDIMLLGTDKRYLEKEVF